MYAIGRHIIEGRLTLTEAASTISLPGLMQLGRLVDAYNDARSRASEYEGEQ